MCHFKHLICFLCSTVNKIFNLWDLHIIAFCVLTILNLGLHKHWWNSLSRMLLQWNLKVDVNKDLLGQKYLTQVDSWQFLMLSSENISSPACQQAVEFFANCLCSGFESKVGKVSGVFPLMWCLFNVLSALKVSEISHIKTLHHSWPSGAPTSASIVMQCHLKCIILFFLNVFFIRNSPMVVLMW